ncbi:tripartite tricarboxylate transporter substrate binding protein [Pigmentiphaga sp.]|uniref:Bug family tripartite tricarboxylate transporter substrate binding protein n=1 Tax=Pigmentiphaga sp. TaxID=1977564 RepID=UPI00128E8E19|nr:tripartite tricarboxylate transporter substrate binding protein [Pigmentiphaga sp.]MPS27699.1 tripartite tricarboxylate transporter substrate binding protein [Alcaligenaceae bacterium SAGV5]MPS55012.1 tripartite tricarboxylate transporter substrate binding protein [Alcaligenaceae bacterium SAGV3]MPT58292.1 tripartite tricarboxylate transporter substrate binding protein [Alcaligenaceae bacterium]
MKNTWTTALAASALVLWTGAAAAADAYPAKPVRWIVPYAVGGGSDFLARTIGAQLSEIVKQPVVVDNKPGGNTAIGAVETARAAPDGYTVLSADNGTLVFNPALYKNLSYNPSRDLAPVTLMGKFPMILIVGPNTEFKDAKDFIAKVKSQPGKYSYASAGAGSPHHLAMELLKERTGMRMLHIAYRGAAPALVDVAGGQLPAMMTDLAAGNAFIKGNKVRPLAVANPTRLPQLPDVPTFAELGIQNVEASAQVGMVAPANTPPEVIAALQKQVTAAIKTPAVNKKLVEFGIEPVGSTPQEYAALVKSESELWQKLIRDLKITLD